MNHLELPKTNTIIDLSESINRELNKDDLHRPVEDRLKAHKHILVKKCLHEIAYIYKLAALIEIAIFLTIAVIFFMFYFFESNVAEFYKINERLKNEIFRYKDIEKVVENANQRNNNETVFDILRTLFDNSTFRELGSELNSPFVCNSIYFNFKLLKTPICIKPSKFDKYFPQLYPNSKNCNSIIETFDYRYNLDQSDSMIEVIKNKIPNQHVRSIQMDFIFIGESILSKFEANFDLRPSSFGTFSTHVFTFKFGDKVTYYQILLVFLVIFLIYYGYEKFYEVWRAEFGSRQRLLINFLDWLSLYLDVMTIYYLSVFTSYDQSHFLSDMKKCRSIKDGHIPSWMNPFISYYQLFYDQFSIFFIISSARIIKYSIIYRPIEIILKSLIAIFSSIARFSPIFLIVYFGFALFGLSVFGPRLAEYSTLNRACLTLTGIVFGRLNFDRYYSYDAFIGTAYFCLYVMCVVIILFNILFAIIAEAFSSMKTYMNSDAQKLNVVPDSVYIKRNFNQLVRFKLRYYDKEVRDILEAMVILKSPNRYLTKVEIEYEFKNLGYEDHVLKRVLEKYGYKEDYAWKKDDMDKFRDRIAKERRELDDLFAVCIQENREMLEKNLKKRMSKSMFVSRERLFHFEMKIRRLKIFVEQLETKSHRVLKILDKNIEKKNNNIDND